MKKVIKSSLNSKPVEAADDNTDTRLNDALSDLKDDFDYALSGLEKLGRDGANANNSALAIAETLSNNIQATIDQIANAVSNPQGE